MDVLAAVGDLIGGALTLAKDIGKGGGGSEEEPNVCMTLLPFALGLAYLAIGSLRRRMRGASGAREQGPMGAPGSV
jgi:hypothetical protein